MKLAKRGESTDLKERASKAESAKFGERAAFVESIITEEQPDDDTGKAKLIEKVGKPFPFSQTSLERIKVPPGQRIKYSDANQTGARLDATGPNKRHPKGTRKQLWKLYRINGKVRAFRMPSLFPLLDWKATEKLILDIDHKVKVQGVDPAAELAKIKATPIPRLDTFASVVAEFIEDYANRRHKKTGRLLSAGQVADTRRYLKQAENKWGNRDIRAIGRREVIEFLTGIAAEHPTTANRAQAALTTMFRWAEQREIVDKSPVTGVERVAPEVKRERHLDALEIKLVWLATESLPYPAKQLVRMLLVCGQRLTETAGMRRSEIVDGVWTIPAARTKANREQTVPLSSLAREIIADCPNLGDYVFSRNGRRPFSSSGVAKKSLDARIAELQHEQGLPPLKPWVLHSLRHTIASQMAELRIERFVVARVLNHVDSEITGRYTHSDFTRFKRAALDAWAKQLREFIGPPILPDNVTEFRAVA